MPIKSPISSWISVSPRITCVIVFSTVGLISLIPVFIGLRVSESPNFEPNVVRHWQAFENINWLSLAVTFPLALDTALDYYLPYTDTTPRWMLVFALAFPALVVITLPEYAYTNSRSIGYCVILFREALVRGALLSFMLDEKSSPNDVKFTGVLGLLNVIVLQIRLWEGFAQRMFNIDWSYFAHALTSCGTLLLCTVVYRHYKINAKVKIHWLHSSFYALLFICSMIVKYALMLITNDITYLGLPDIVICVVATLIPGRLARHEKSIAEIILSSKRDYIGYMSHEIRTPLNAIFMGIQLLGKEYRNELSAMNDCSIILGDIEDSCRVAINILNEFLLVHKIEAGTLTVEKKLIPAIDLIEGVAVSFENQARLQGINFRCRDDLHIDPLLYRLEGHVNVDERKIAHILRNLISNALKFTPSGGSVKVFTKVRRRKNAAVPLIESRASVQPVGLSILEQCASTLERLTPTSSFNLNDYILRIEVHDTGVGISEENQKMLFNDNVQFNSAKLQNGGGAGIGLWISKMIADLHGGNFGLESTSNSGTVFFLELDLCEGSSDIESNLITSFSSKTCERTIRDSSCTTSSHASVKYNSPGSPRNATIPPFLKVLIVDDSPVNRKMTHRLIKSTVPCIKHAENGIEAVAKVQESMESLAPFDLIFMDATMPEMGGAEATRRIRSMGFKGKIVFLTGNATPEEREDFIRSGANDVLLKPCSLEKIERVLVLLG